MIAVIADDFTGAAEIGGIALRQGFNATIETSLIPPYDTEVLIIATNTRAESPEQARKTIHELTLRLLELKPEMIYKKIDSVLRGNVGEELLEQMAVSGKSRVLIIPPNPSLNRIIRDGIYYYNGVPLNRSSFSISAKANQLSSDVMELMGETSAKHTTIISKGEALPVGGLIIGNTVDEADLDHWAEQLDEQTVMAGGSSFFNALLKKKKPGHTPNGGKVLFLGGNKLIVCGSAFESSRQVVADAARSGQFTAHMPAHLFCGGTDREELMMQWEAEIIKGLNENGTVIVAVDVLVSPEAENLPAEVSKALATVVERVMERVRVQELCIEGGFTASSIFKKLKYEKFYPVEELAMGVIRMKVEGDDGVFLTLKPGSYQWPPSIWKYEQQF